MKIVLTGANGQLGSDLRLALAGEQLLCPTKEELDIARFEAVNDYVTRVAPDLIINTAAFHQVDKCEDDCARSFLVNTCAVKNLADIGKRLNIPLVHYSTDYVFGADNARATPYREDDAPGPVNIYGISKLAGEYAVRYSGCKHYLIRTAALFGAAGSSGKGGNFIETMLRLAKEKGAVKVKNDEFTSPTYTKELATVTARLIKTGQFGTYHITSQGQCSWFEFAQEIFKITGAVVECLPISSAEMPTPARRPGYSVLDNYNLRALGLDQMSDWRAALPKYLKEKNYL